MLARYPCGVLRGTLPMETGAIFEGRSVEVVGVQVALAVEDRSARRANDNIHRQLTVELE